MATDQQNEVQTLRYIQQNEIQINKFFKSMDFRKKNFQSNQKSQQQKTQQSKKKKQAPNYVKNYRGQKVFSIEQLRKKYEEAIPGTKWFTLPYCRRTIFGKIQFWCGASFIFTYIWSTYYMRKNSLTSLHFKQYMKAYGIMALASCAYVFAQSIFFEPYCDINSYHYKNTENNIFIARDIKKQLNELKK